MKIQAFWKRQRFEVDLTVSNTPDGAYEVGVMLPGNKLASGIGDSYLEAVNAVRSKIEPHDWLLGINASRVDAGILPDAEPTVDTITIIENEQPVTVYTLGDADLTKLGTLEQQAQHFAGLVAQQQTIEKYTKEAKAAPKTGVLKKRAPTRRTATVSTILTLLSALYPISYFWIPNQVEYIGLWGIFGLLIYGSIVAINVENTVIRGKSSFSLTFSITAPLIVAVVVWYLQTSGNIEILWNVAPFLRP